MKRIKRSTIKSGMPVFYIKNSLAQTKSNETKNTNSTQDYHIWKAVLL